MTSSVDDKKKVDEEEPDAPEDDKPMTFWEHLEELRSRIVRSVIAIFAGMCAIWYFKEDILVALYKPFHDAWKAQDPNAETTLNFKSPGDAFSGYVNMCLVGGIVIAAPVIFYQLWSFVAPGLYAREKRYVIPFVTFSSALFIGGAYFGYRVALAISFGYFLSFSGDLGGIVRIQPTIMMEDYLDFILKMLLGFGIIFEIPVLCLFLARIGLLTHRKMIRWARYYVFIAAVVAAALTPPEATSMMVMFVPALGLYFGSIGLVYLVQRKDVVLAELEREKEEKAAKEEEEREKQKEEKLAKAKR